MSKIKIEVTAKFEFEIEENDLVDEFNDSTSEVAEAVIEAVDRHFGERSVGAEYSSFELGIIE